MKYLYDISYLLIISGIILIIFTQIKDLKKRKLNLIKHNSFNYAVLIPARDESKVIEGLLVSLKKQAKMEDVYVIVETKDDPTIKICEKYQAKVIFRKDLSKKRKGYALDEAIKEILKKHHYDLYFIFDADNILEDDFIEKMLNIYKEGYEIATGYRNIKNSENVITTCSILTFSMINTLINKIKNKRHQAIIISGTGFFISGRLIELWHGYPFFSLTEDYELSLYASTNNIATYYNEDASFYDAQPTSLKVSITQRTRWIKGFFDSRKINLKDIKDDYPKLIGVTPIILIIIGTFIFLILSLINFLKEVSLNNIIYVNYLSLFISIPILIYFILMIFTFIILAKENGKLNVSYKQMLQALFYNPIFLLSYLICLFKALFHKDLKWVKIEH